MTLNANIVRNEYVTVGGETDFPFTWKIYDETEIKVYEYDVGTVCTESDVLTLGIDYTIDPADIGVENGGDVTFVVPATAGKNVVLVSNLPSDRNVNYVNNSDFRPPIINDDFDRNLSISKQQEAALLRVPKIKDCVVDINGVELEPPVAGSFLQWNESGDAVINATVLTDPDLYPEILYEKTDTQDLLGDTLPTGFIPIDDLIGTLDAESVYDVKIDLRVSCPNTVTAITAQLVASGLIDSTFAPVNAEQQTTGNPPLAKTGQTTTSPTGWDSAGFDDQERAVFAEGRFYNPNSEAVTLQVEILKQGTAGLDIRVFPRSALILKKFELPPSTGGVIEPRPVIPPPPPPPVGGDDYIIIWAPLFAPFVYLEYNDTSGATFEPIDPPIAFPDFQIAGAGDFHPTGARALLGRGETNSDTNQLIWNSELGATDDSWFELQSISFGFGNSTFSDAKFDNGGNRLFLINAEVSTDFAYWDTSSEPYVKLPDPAILPESKSYIAVRSDDAAIAMNGRSFVGSPIIELYKTDVVPIVKGNSITATSDSNYIDIHPTEDVLVTVSNPGNSLEFWDIAGDVTSITPTVMTLNVVIGSILPTDPFAAKFNSDGSVLVVTGDGGNRIWLYTVQRAGSIITIESFENSLTLAQPYFDIRWTDDDRFVILLGNAPEGLKILDAQNSYANVAIPGSVNLAQQGDFIMQHTGAITPIENENLVAFDYTTGANFYDYTGVSGSTFSPIAPALTYPRTSAWKSGGAEYVTGDEEDLKVYDSSAGGAGGWTLSQTVFTLSNISFFWRQTVFTPDNNWLFAVTNETAITDNLVYFDSSTAGAWVQATNPVSMPPAISDVAVRKNTSDVVVFVGFQSRNVYPYKIADPLVPGNVFLSDGTTDTNRSIDISVNDILAISQADGVVPLQFWDTTNDPTIVTWPQFTETTEPGYVAPDTPFHLAFSPAGNFLAVVGFGGDRIWVYKITKDTVSNVNLEYVSSGISLPAQQYFHVSWSPDGRFIIVSGEDTTTPFAIFDAFNSFATVTVPGSTAGLFGQWGTAT